MKILTVMVTVFVVIMASVSATRDSAESRAIFVWLHMVIIAKQSATRKARALVTDVVMVRVHVNAFLASEVKIVSKLNANEQYLEKAASNNVSTTPLVAVMEDATAMEVAIALVPLTLQLVTRAQ